MLRLLSAFFEIALHRRGPDSLPASRFLLGLAIAANLILLFIALQLRNEAQPFLLPALLVETGLGVLFVWSLLRAFELQRRLLQTVTALFGIDALMTVLALPFLSARSLEEGIPTADPGVAAFGVPEIAILAIWLWNIDVWGFVVGRAIGRPYFLGLAFVIGWWLLMESLHAAMFPPLPT